MSAFQSQWGGKQTYRRGAQRQAGAPGTCCDPGLWCAIATFGTPRGRRIIIQGNNPERTWSCSRLATRPAANHHPHYRPSTIANVSGTAVRNRDPPIRDYFQNAGGFFRKPGNERVFRNARAFANPSHGHSGATR